MINAVSVTSEVNSQPPADLPRFIAIEGAIGVGKTTLAKRLAHTFNYSTLLEAAEENPFLERFYQNPRQVALQTQLHFLFQRANQLQSLRQDDLFEAIRVADFLMEKDRLFARVNLDDEEYRLYDQVYQHLTIDAPTPDLVVYLQAPIDVLLQRINKRGKEVERNIQPEYLQQLNESYTRLFHYYDDAPVLIVNAAEINFADNEEDYQMLVKAVLETKSGRQYFNPTRL